MVVQSDDAAGSNAYFVEEHHRVRVTAHGLRELPPFVVPDVCPGRKTPFLAVKHPAHPYKSAIENRSRDLDLGI